MLFTLVYAYLSFVLKWKNGRRRMKFFRLIRSLCRHSSISAVQGSGAVSSGGGSVVQSAHNKEALELVTESDGRIEVGPKAILDLRGWTLYMGVSPEEIRADGQHFMLFEAVSNAAPSHLGLSSMKVTDYGTPLAWKAGPPFKFLMRCDLDNLVTLVMGMIDRRLTAEDNLDIQSLTTVNVKGHADRLLQTHGAAASVWKSSSSQPIGAELQDIHSVGSSNESLASVGRDSLDLQQLSALTQSADVDICDEEIQNVLDSESDDGDCAAGEAMAEFAEDTNIEIEPSLQNGFRASIETDKSKPPNVLIYCGKKDSSRKFDGVRQIFAHCLQPDRYVIYHLKHDQVHTAPWKDNCALLILASEKLYDRVDEAVYEYFKQGGKVLSFCSSLDNFVVKRNAYQDSPMNVLLLNCGKRSNVTVIGGRFCFEDVHEKESLMRPNDISSVEVLGVASEFRDKPVIVKVTSAAKDSEKSGTAILSQVYLDKDPGEMGISTKIFTLLKESNPVKFEIMSDLLEQLGMDCSKQPAPQLSPGVMLEKQQNQISHVMEALSARIKEGVIRTPKKTIQFVEEGSGLSPSVTDDTLPVLTSSGPQTKFLYFDPEVFFSHLSTDSLGQVILYTDVVPTTMTLMDGMMFSLPQDIGLVAIAGRQTNGRGRGGNGWISPVGCAMFTAHVRLALDSQLGQKAAFIQHITAVAVVHSIRKLTPYKDVDLRVKWPNDLYFGNSMKLGGVIVTSSIMNGVMHALVGCGFNVSNSNPTICINDIIQQYNQENGTDLKPFTTEELLGRVITTMESLISEFQKKGPECFCDLYYKYWLHSGSRVSLEKEGGLEVTIQGLDEHGYLEVVTPDGKPLSLQPDGNTFDMLRNLISIKSR